MDTALLTTARDVGGWVFAAVFIAGAAVTFFRAFQRGDLVPGALLNRALDQNDKLTLAVGALTASVNSLSDQVAELRRLPPADRRR